MIMKPLQNDSTTPEQSKRLLKLGVPADSANCYYDGRKILRVRSEDWMLKPDFFKEYSYFTPCWSAGRLIEIYNECNSLADEYKTRYGVNIIEDIIRNFETPYSFTHCIEFDFSKLED